MQRKNIYLQRIKRFCERITKLKYSDPSPLEAEYIYDKIEPISYETALQSQFKPISVGEVWGELWGCAWFRFRGIVPEAFAGREVGALIDLNGEGCVWKDGVPWVGLTNKIHWDLRSGKYFVPLLDSASGGEKVELLVEIGANGLFGSGQNDYRLQQAEIVCVNRKIWKLELDLKVLIDLMESLEENSPRRNKLLSGLNLICNNWNDGSGIDECLEISDQMLSKPANASSLTAYSIGHAHLDLAWLWPVRETRRKGGRTFATALRLLEEFPEYKFGASQPQLYEWIKKDYPQLFDQVKQAVKDGRWEVQGGMWVEPDMNIPNSESLVRQCLYGKKFFRDEMGIEINNLWLPDVFGYSAALPQILKKCGIDFFMTQKISWNETNTFPHHTFIWKGIDGTGILTHFLPTNDYNLANLPSQLIASEKRYAQNDVSDEFLNLYGIGDGGGGPSREHIELGIRQQDLEGTPRFRFSFARDFFEKIADIPTEKLPVWAGELYLELHRGTYTTQALMKLHNRRLEQKLHDIEFLGVITGNFPKKEIDQIWKDTLLNQFHDILPGSSINWVYKDANSLSRKNLKKLQEIEEALLISKFGKADKATGRYVLINTQPWKRREIVSIPAEAGTYWVGDGIVSGICTAEDGIIDCQIELPPLGYGCIQLEETAQEFPDDQAKLKAGFSYLENELIRVELDGDGAFISIFDKEEKREILAGKANLLQLWEDEPNNWGAWDINHFYRETAPVQAERMETTIECVSPFKATISQKLRISNSTIIQKISLEKDTKLIKVENKVDWKEVHKMLRVSAEVMLSCDSASYEIQFGTLKRPTHSNTSWDAAKFEVAGQKFADLSQPDYGFAIINNCKYGHYIKENIVDLTLLRSPQDTDKEADIHEHTFTYAYYPHKADLINSDVLQQAHNLNSPLIRHEVSELPGKLKFGYFTIEGDGVKIDTVKLPETGKGVILRLYETKGRSTKVKLSAYRNWQKIIETNLLEMEEGELGEDNNSLDLLFEPFEIRTFRLIFH
jgi:alpha-mannosidase